MGKIGESRVNSYGAVGRDICWKVFQRHGQIGQLLFFEEFIVKMYKVRNCSYYKAIILSAIKVGTGIVTN